MAEMEEALHDSMLRLVRCKEEKELDHGTRAGWLGANTSWEDLTGQSGIQLG